MHVHDLDVGCQAIFWHEDEGLVQTLLDEVNCEGDEERLIDCPANSVGHHDCSNLENAGVICSLDYGKFPEYTV